MQCQPVREDRTEHMPVLDLHQVYSHTAAHSTSTLIVSTDADASADRYIA